jgi:hypothetical protein
MALGKVHAHRLINFANHHLLGFVWSFRGCSVELTELGFVCSCGKKDKCYHIQSVELGLLGVGQKYYK